MIGHAFSRVAAERLFAPRTPSGTRKERRTPLYTEPKFGCKIDILCDFSVNRVLRYLYIWQDRAEQRGRLSTMDARMLKDIGISRHDAAQEARKPFWMA